MLPWPVTMVVRFGIIFMFMLNLAATTRKYSFVIAPFVVGSYSRCHVSTLISLSSPITTLFGTIL
jgi:hypothetical protein